ncbi:YhdP family protein [Desulfobacula sp.]|uniref:YhdP family protein n=1 Tax=Desulfobacula sp. TaxID=2593537 RepID=UPI002714B756|nr:AsmA-like C-terminal domain-containing protein [Desulfobacula sp.]
MKPFYKIKKSVIYSIVLIFTLILSSPFLITWFINTSYIKNKISSFIYQKTGADIDSSKLSLTLFPQASFNIENFNFNPDNRININIKFLKFDVDIQKLLRGKINVDQITIEKPEIKTISIKEKQSALPVDFSVSKHIKDLKKIFAFLPEHQNSVELRFKNAMSQYFKQMDGSLYLSKEKKEIILNTTIKNIEFRPSTLTNASLEKYLDLESIELDQLKSTVKLSSEGEIQGQCSFIAPKLKSKNNHILFDANIIESSFKLSDDFYQIDIKPFKLNYPNGLVAIHFEDNQIQKKSKIQFTGTDIHIDQAREMSLLLFKDNEITKSIFKILHSGIAPKINASFQSKELKDLFNGNHLTLKGDIEDGLVHIPQTNLIASHVFGAAQIHNGVLDIKTTNAIIQSSKIGKSSLTIDLLNYKDFPFQGEFLLDVDLSMIPQTLISLLPDTLLAKELSLVHDVTGRSKAKLNLSLEQGFADLNVKINTNDFSVTGLYDRIPGDITLENVNFNYEPDIVYLKRLNGVINGSTIYDLNTVLAFKDEAQISIQSGSGMIYLDSMIPWLMSYEKTKEIISPVRAGSGKIHVTSINLSGPILNPDLWEYDLKGTGVEIDVTTQLNHKQIEDLSCQYHISDDLLNLKTIQMKINDLSWMEPLIEKKYSDNILVPFDMENGNFHIGTKDSFFKSSLKFAGGPELYIDLKGKTPASLTLNSIKFIDPGLSNGSISFNHNNDKPLFDFNGILDTTTLNKVVVPDSYWSKKIDALTKGQSILIYTDKDSTLNIITKRLDLNSLISHSKPFSLNNRLLSNKIINLKTDELKLKNLTITDIDSTLSFKKDLLSVRFKKALLCDLETSGYINLKKDVIYANIPFEANNKANIKDLLTCLFQKNEFMDGQYSLTGSILSNDTKKDFLNKLTGAFIFNAEKGRIYKLTLLSRILSVLNVSKIFKGKIPNVTQDGFAYKNISIEADIKDSTIYLTKAIIDGQDMTLIFSGWIDPVNDKIDLTCLVAPFKTVDLIIEHIPIVNTFLEGRLLSVPVKATGKLSDPIVIPLHPSSVGKSLINMMSNILKTPVKLWDKVYSE